jgi:protein ImuB
VRRIVAVHLPDWAPQETAVFEAVLVALDQVSATVAVLEPGLAVVRLGRWAADEAALCEELIDTVSGLAGQDCATGVADGVFAAVLAARAGRIVPPGGDGPFLAPFDIEALQVTGLVDASVCAVLRRLGIGTIADFTALPSAAVLERFGAGAWEAQRLAAGAASRPLAARRPVPDLTVTVAPDEPFADLEQALFAVRPLAERLLQGLADRSLTCTRVAVAATTAGPVVRERTWRIDPAAGVDAVVERVRWQLEG